MLAWRPTHLSRTQTHTGIVVVVAVIKSPITHADTVTKSPDPHIVSHYGTHGTDRCVVRCVYNIYCVRRRAYERVDVHGVDVSCGAVCVRRRAYVRVDVHGVGVSCGARTSAGKYICGLCS